MKQFFLRDKTMIFATFNDGSLDGLVYLVSSSHKWALCLKDFSPHLRGILENWTKFEGPLKELFQKLEGPLPNKIEFESIKDKLHSPMPRSFQWLDGSAFLNHVILVRKARKAEIPESLTQTPLMYQGGSDTFLAPTAPIELIDPQHGLDFEAEIVVVTDFVPLGTSAKDAPKHIKLIMLVNDVTLRGLVPAELSMGFGFLQSKPSSAFSPLALTPCELQSEDPSLNFFKDTRLHLPLNTYWNDQLFGSPNGGEMHFNFAQLIEHAAKTRNLSAGTIIGSGTVSNEELKTGSSCIVEQRTLEQLQSGQVKTRYMEVGDRVKIEMISPSGKNLFGTIKQKVQSLHK
jgi:fumarylacetoacetate (FAA) hydrolase